MRTVVGLYDRLEDAHRVIEALIRSGIPHDRVGIIARDVDQKYAGYLESKKSFERQDLSEGATTGAVVGGIGGLLIGLGALAIPGIGPVIAAGPLVSALAGAGIGAAAGGVLGALVDLGIPEEHANAYAEGLRRGGTLVYARVEDNQADKAVQIMDRFNPVDINQRTQEWKRNQWSRFDQKSQPLTTPEIERERSHYMTDIPVTGDREMTFPVVEEEVQIGKREVDKGGVRINTYTTEKKVEKDVHLRDEHISVERRPVNREATEADFTAFKEGSMELHETTEEPVVEKRSRVVEEVHVNKDVDEHVETVSETVRRKDVNVEQIGKTGDWTQHEKMFRQDFQTRYGTQGRNFETYMPAYRYGYELRSNPRFSRYTSWQQAEAEARSEWQRRGEKTAWEEIKDAVRYAWESITR